MGSLKMRPKHRDIEKPFYEDAYDDPETRLARGFGWDVNPSPSMVEIFEQHVRTTLAHPASVRVLDIGIGADGRNAKYFLEQGFEVVGVDFSQNAIRHCESTLAKVFPNNLILVEKDISIPGAIDGLEMFDIIVDWSVMDHIRRAYLPSYKRNILWALKKGGYLLTSQFATPMPEKFRPLKGQDYHLYHGHYMRCYTLAKLRSEFPQFEVVDLRESCPEDAINGILIHTMLLKKE